MGLFVTAGGEFGWMLQTTTGRPAGAFGTAVTGSGSANTMGSWAQLIAGASVIEDVWGILININSVGGTGVAHDTLVDIGVDPGGGSSYTVKIPYLTGSDATTYILGGGVWYYFPLFIPAGSSIAARCQGQAVSQTARVWATLYGQPRNPAQTRVGASVAAIGVTAASSRGTTITAGTTSEGAWTSIGSTTFKSWWFQLGHCYNGTAQVAATWVWDISRGNGSAYNLMCTDIRTETTTAELTSMPPYFQGAVNEIGSGDALYARGQCSGTPAATTGVIIYALG